MEKATALNGSASQHLASMDTGDLIQRLQAVESSLAQMLSREQELTREMDTIEQNRKMAEAEKRELGILVVKRLGLGDLVERKTLDPRVQVIPEKKRNTKNMGRWPKGFSPNDRKLIDYLRGRPEHTAKVADIHSTAFRDKTYVGASVALATAHKRGVVRRVGYGLWQLVEGAEEQTGA